MKKTAFCKINLTLEILGTKRDDGFHDLKTIMHKVPLGDEIEVLCSDGEGNITLVCDSDVCAKEDNLAYKAAKMYLERYGKSTGNGANVQINLRKITPTGAGLGGGSADAAIVLDMMQEILGGITDEEILHMASALGSDVPFCLKRYLSAFCTGRGEICRPISTLPEGTCLVLAKPLEGINTKGIYGEYDKKFGDDYSKSASDGMEDALLSASLSDVAKHVMNDFECVCIPRLPEIQHIKDRMKSLGALCSSMSGSGSSVFGIFDNKDKAEKCFEALKNEGLKEIFCCYPDDFRRMYEN